MQRSQLLVGNDASELGMELAPLGGIGEERVQRGELRLAADHVHAQLARQDRLVTHVRERCDNNRA